MNEVEIAVFLETSDVMANSKVSFIGSGEANLNYLAESGDGKVVVRAARQDVPTTPRFKNEHHFMAFISAMGISFAPRTLLYDETKEIHVISYVPGLDRSVVDLDPTQRDVFISQLKFLNSITYEQYVSWCDSQHIVAKSVRTSEVRIQVNIFDRLSYIASQKDNALAVEVLKWAELKKERFFNLEKNVVKKNSFFHGDLRWNVGGGNLRVEDNRVSFIDWELASFTHDGMLEIADVLGSIPLQHFDVARDIYLAYIHNESDLDHMNKAIEYGILWGKFANPLWSAERYLNLYNTEGADLSRYLDLTKQGMQDAEYFFEREFKDWF
jgi:Phosphotransferase enzyme family